MKAINDFIKSGRLSRIVVVFCAGMLVWMTAACNANPPAPNVSGTGSYYENRGQATELYDPIQDKKGGMNQYEDVKPTASTRESEAKAKQLVDRAKANTERAASRPEDYARNYRSGKPLGERVEDLADDVTDSVEEVTEGVSRGTQRGVRNLRDNASDAAKDATQGAERATDKAADYVRDRV